MNREKRAIKVGFPFGLYFKQLFSGDPYVRYINPFSFWRRYKIDRLEASYALNTVRHLENCLLLDCQAAIQTNIGLNLDYTSAAIYSLFPQARSNAIHISQPRIELKYRGVSYFIEDISNIDVHLVKINSRIVSSNSFRTPNHADNINASEKSNSDR